MCLMERIGRMGRMGQMGWMGRMGQMGRMRRVGWMGQASPLVVVQRIAACFRVNEDKWDGWDR